MTRSRDVGWVGEKESRIKVVEQYKNHKKLSKSKKQVYINKILNSVYTTLDVGPISCLTFTYASLHFL